MNRTIYGLDVAKRVFQLYWIDVDTGEIYNRRFSRQQLIEFLANRPAGQVALEACGSGHWWARKIQALGHEVMLIHAKFIRPFVQTNKTDAADARAIWRAANQPEMRTVAVKSEEQQAMLGLHRMRSQLIKFRTMQVNQLRGLLYEFGFVFKSGRKAGLAEIRTRMAELEQAVPGLLWEAVKAQLVRLTQLDDEVKALEARINHWQKAQPACKAIAEVPGFGPLVATAFVATIGKANAFQSGREVAAFIGVVPKQSGTGGKVKLGGISKRGDPYLRTLLIHGARMVLTRAKDKGAWAESLLKRRPTNVAVLAMANKMARTAWAILAHDRLYQRNYVSVKPA